jgi:2-succinyl-5-enolpyruvyl-6-hydroxy-3-cyclohexene-1-carboxylate synthase
MTDGSDVDRSKGRSEPGREDPPERKTNPATVWAGTLVTELAAGGLETVCIAPGSRSTSLALAFHAHEDVETCSILDERSAGYVALGRGKATGRPTAVLTTSGTATANLHPAVVEAHQSRTPLLVLTADRPPELQDSGANQTVDQDDLYGDATRWSRTLQAPTTDARSLRSLRTTAARALSATTGTPPGPVHLNCPFRKPFEPSNPSGDPLAIPDSTSDARASPAVDSHHGSQTLPDLDPLVDVVRSAKRGLIVAGPADPGFDGTAVGQLAATTGFPLLADPLSGLRFGPRPDGATVCTGYDGYLHAIEDWGGSNHDEWPGPDLVLRVGASPTSKRLRTWLRDRAARQFVVDPAGGWREATFSATDLVIADPDRFAAALVDAIPEDGTATDGEWSARFGRAERTYWSVVADAGRPPEAAVLAGAIESAPAGGTVVVGNSTPVRDVDRFVASSDRQRTVLGNRGASGIDGVTSTAIGAAHASEGPTACVLGDLSTVHDMSGLTAIERCGVDLTVVVVNNDGGGIFHALPIADIDPPFTSHFRTPHGVDFSAVAAAVGIEYVHSSVETFPAEYRECLTGDGAHLLEVQTDAEGHHRNRERLDERVTAAFASDESP